MDELASSPSSPSSIEDIGPEETIDEETLDIKQTKHSKSLPKRALVEKFSPRRSHSGKL